MTEATAIAEAADVDRRRARRNVVVLAAAQALGGAGAPINMAISSLAGHGLLGADKSLATLPITAFVLGTAAGTVPAAMLMRSLGRRLGLVTGLLVGAGGGLIQAAAMVLGSFWLLAAGAFLMGFASAFVQQFRFAAADVASPAFRPKAISWVLAGGIVSAVLGPQAVIRFGDLFAPVPYAGAYVAAAGLSLAAAFVLIGLDAPRPKPTERARGGRPLGRIIRQPRFVVAVGCAVVSYSLMNLVMTAAPLAMVLHGHHRNAAMLGIQWHVLAMFAPSFATGALIARYGADRIVALGLVLLIGCAVAALSGLGIWNFWTALVLLGLGWNFGFIGGTAMLTDVYRPVEAEKVQALNDFLVFGAVAASSLLSGKLLVGGGWAAVNLVILPAAAACLAALGWMALRRRGTPRPAALDAP